MADGRKNQTLREKYPKATPLTGSSGEMLKWDREGTEIEGRFLGLKEGTMGGQIGTLDTGKDVIAFSAPTKLANALSDLKVGTRVIIRYLGEVKSKKGTTFKDFEAVAIPD